MCGLFRRHYATSVLNKLRLSTSIYLIYKCILEEQNFIDFLHFFPYHGVYIIISIAKLQYNGSYRSVWRYHLILKKHSLLDVEFSKLNCDDFFQMFSHHLVIFFNLICLICMDMPNIYIYLKYKFKEHELMLMILFNFKSVYYAWICQVYFLFNLV